MNRFIPHFQPIVDITRCRISGYEALAREQLENGDGVSCGKYFADPSTEREFLRDMDRCVRRKALASMADMPEETFLTLNISPEWIQQLPREGVVPTIAMLDEFGVDPGRVVIEITETEGDLELIQRLVSQYREAGLKIAIDDFGAGYSELGRLVALEPDLIKLDMRFFKAAVEGGIAHDAVRAIGFMAERIGCEILCEGVETEKEFEFAVETGATLIQGFLFHPAREHFVAPEEPGEQLRTLLNCFVARKAEEEKNHISRHESMKQYATVLTDILLLGEPDLAQLTRPPEGFVRFYLCRPNGDQISPNFDVAAGHWIEDRSCLGMNWAGRPFLYQILALRQLMEKQCVTTRPYRDRTSGTLLQTIGLTLDHERILLIDYEAM